MTDVSEQSVAEVADVLNRTADLIEPEGAWTQKAGARDARGEVVGWNAFNASCWCLIAAISVAARDEKLASKARIFMREMVPAGYLSDWNDAPDRTQSEVVAALRSAALLAAPRAGEGVNRG